MCSCISERVLTHGDIGTQTSQLKKEFVPLADFFQLDGEHWWHGGTSNDKENGSFREKETSTKVKVSARVLVIVSPCGIGSTLTLQVASPVACLLMTVSHSSERLLSRSELHRRSVGLNGSRRV